MDIQQDEITDLLSFFSKNTYNAWDTHPQVQNVMQRCLDLFALDYTYSVVSNSNGELSTNYPSSLVVLEGDKDNSASKDETTTGASSEESPPLVAASMPPSTNGHGHIEATPVSSSHSSMTISSLDGFNPVQDLAKIKDLCSKARYARCRARFPVPVILYNNKHICRSATLSGGPEIYGRASFDYFFSGSSATEAKSDEPEVAEADVIVPDSEGQGQGDWQLFDRVRNQDIRLLKAFQVQTIVDLMVEKKKVKFGVYVTSSEKVDKKDRYRDFNLISLPYPGCEFFKQYRDNGYNAEELMFEWNQGHVDANIYVPSDVSTDALNLEWSQYRKWDLVRLTQNYVKLLLAYLRGNNRGMLIHCISGWDRTPLFVSLLRLSLWADGAIHKSLNAEQILYLTLAYDWLLFGHNLEDRLNKGEEILFFCFYFLSHIVDDEYSIAPQNELSLTIHNGSEATELQTHDDIPSVEVRPNSSGITNGNLVKNDQKDSSADAAQLVETEPERCQESSKQTVNGDDQSQADSGAQDSENVNGVLNGFKSRAWEDEPVLPDANLTKECPSVQSQPNSVQDVHLENGTSTSTSCILSDNSSGSSGLAEDAPVSEITGGVTPGVEEDSAPEVSLNNGLNAVDEEKRQVNGVNESNNEDTPNPSHLPSNNNSVPDSQPHATVDSAGLSNNISELTSHSNGTASGNGEVQSGLKESELKEKSEIEASMKQTMRCERLHLVRAHFYALYGSAIGFQSRHNVSDTNGGSGLSVIIDNIATKVGIRVANRSTS